MNPRRIRLSTHLSRCLRILAVALILCFSASMPPAHAEDAPASASVQASDSAEGFEWKDYQDPALKRPDENPVAGAIGFVLKFGLVVGMIYGVAWLYKRGLIPKGLLAAANAAPGPGRARSRLADLMSLRGAPGVNAVGGPHGLRVVGSLPLRGAQSLHVVEVGDRVLVVGSDGRETMVKLTEWAQTPGSVSEPSFDAVIEQANLGAGGDLEGDFSNELESTLRRIIRPKRGQQ